MSFTSQSRTFSLSGPSWLALIAAVWWAALLNPAQARSFTTGMFDGVGSPAAVVSADRHLSLQTNDRRRVDPVRFGHSPAAPASVFTFTLSLEPIQWLATTAHPPASRPARSPAQPRAPPAHR